MDNLEREQLKKEIREEMEYEEKVKRLREKNEKDMKKQQRNDKIKNNAPEFLTLIIWICCILGAVIGAIAGSILNNILNFNKKSGTTIEKEMNIAMEKLDKDYKFMLLRIEKQFEALGDLLSVAFSVENNLQLLEESMKVAYAFGVEKEKIISTTDELDDFMRN